MAMWSVRERTVQREVHRDHAAHTAHFKPSRLAAHSQFIGISLKLELLNVTRPTLLKAPVPVWYANSSHRAPTFSVSSCRLTATKGRSSTSPSVRACHVKNLICANGCPPCDALWAVARQRTRVARLGEPHEGGWEGARATKVVACWTLEGE